MEALLDPDDTTSGLLASVRTSRAVAEQADRDVLIAAARFAALHSVDTVEEAARLDGDVFGDRMLPLAGPGAPLVSEAAAVATTRTQPRPAMSSDRAGCRQPTSTPSGTRCWDMPSGLTPPTPKTSPNARWRQA